MPMHSNRMAPVHKPIAQSKNMRQELDITVVYGNQNCSFAEDDYCGYHDASPGPVKWIRSKNFKPGPPGTLDFEAPMHLFSHNISSVFDWCFMNLADSCVILEVLHLRFHKGLSTELVAYDAPLTVKLV